MTDEPPHDDPPRDDELPPHDDPPRDDKLPPHDDTPRDDEPPHDDTPHEQAPFVPATRNRGTTGTLRLASLIARTSLRRALRRAFARPRRTAVVVLFFAVVWGSVLLDGPGGPPAPGGVDSLGNGVVFGIYARGLAAIGWLGAVALAAVGATTRLDDVDAAALTLPAAGVRATFLGTLAAEHARRFAVIGGFASLAVVSVATGGGGVGTLPTGGVAVLCVFVTAELVGHVLALGWIDRTGGDVLSPGLRLLVAGAGLMGVTLGVARLDLLVPWFAGTPLGWYGDLFLLGTPAPTRPRLATAAVVVSVAAVAPLYLLAERLARRVWFRDPPAPGAGGGRATTVTADTLLASRLPVDGPSRAVARRVWLQTVRRPKTLVFLGIPFLFAGTVVVSGDYPPAFPVLLGLYGAWAAGIGTTLNPLSGEGAGLPLLLTSPMAGGGVVRGYVLASVSVAAPAVAAVVLLAAPLAGFSPQLTLAGVVVGVGLTLTTAPVSVAVGVGIPRIERLNATSVDGPLTPSKFALAAHSLVILLLSLPALAGVALEPQFGAWALWLGVAASLALASLGGALGYRYAAARFGRLRLA